MPKIKVESVVPICPRCGKTRLLDFRHRKLNRCWRCNKKVDTFKDGIAKTVRETIGYPARWVDDALMVAYEGVPIWLELKELENMKEALGIILRRKYNERANLSED